MLVVEERVPLKQGLKLIKDGQSRILNLVEERVPLKQGLKLQNAVAQYVDMDS